ncbi:MAG TPA: outer membrane beta-barrel protein [Aequorivita sp.]|nr:outer membrane beta-barrel protein [Aequorivita sp.]
MTFKNFIIAAFFLLIFHQINAQRNYKGYNLLGITGGVSFMGIETDDFVVKRGTGFSGGFTNRGAFRNNFDLIYGINYQNSKLAIEGRNVDEAQYMNYTIQGAQIKFLGSYNIVVKHLSLEFGPIFNINGKMKLDQKSQENYILSGYESLAAKAIEDISKFNILLAGGLTAGLENFRVSAQYQYGLLNMFTPLNSKDLEKNDFNGHSSTILLAAVIYF